MPDQQQGRWRAPNLHLMVEVGRPTPERAADGAWQEGFDMTQAEARVELDALEAEIDRLRPLAALAGVHYLEINAAAAMSGVHEDGVTHREANFARAYDAEKQRQALHADQKEG